MAVKRGAKQDNAATCFRLPGQQRQRRQQRQYCQPASTPKQSLGPWLAGTAPPPHTARQTRSAADTTRRIVRAASQTAPDKMPTPARPTSRALPRMADT